MRIVLLFITLILLQNFCISNTLVITSIDKSNYPEIQINFVYLDDDNNTIPVNRNSVNFFENNEPINDFQIECNNEQDLQSISSVLSIDRSSSMNEDDRIGSAKNSAKLWVNLLDDNSECGLTMFSSDTRLLSNLTKDKEALKNLIDDISTFGGTDFDKAFNDADDGAFIAFSNASHPKILLFLTDGNDENFNATEIITEANDRNIKIYSIGLETTLNSEVKKLCDQTGGLWFDNTNKDNLNSLFQTILFIARGGGSCTLTYNAEGCEKQRSLLLILDSETANGVLNISNDEIAGYTISPQNLIFGERNNSQNQHHYFEIKSKIEDLTINDILPSNSELEITDFGGTPPPFTLNMNEKRVISFIKVDDDNYIDSEIKILSNSCYDRTFTAEINRSLGMNRPVGLEVEYPNGGEVLYFGSESNISWTSDSTDLQLTLEVSTDAGVTWNKLDSNNKDEIWNWQNINLGPSDSCIVRVKQDKSTLPVFLTNNVDYLEIGDNDFIRVQSIQVKEDAKYVFVEFFDSVFFKDDSVKSEDYDGNHYGILKLEDNQISGVRTFKGNHKSNLLIDNSALYLITNFVDATLVENLGVTNPGFNNIGILKYDFDLNLVDSKLISNESNSIPFRFTDTDLFNDSLYVLVESFSDFRVEDEIISRGIVTNNPAYHILTFDNNLNFITNDSFEPQDNDDEISFSSLQVKEDEILLGGYTTGWEEFNELSYDANKDSASFFTISIYKNRNKELRNYIEVGLFDDEQFIDSYSLNDMYFLLVYTDSSMLVGNDNYKIEKNNLARNTLVCLNLQGDYQWHKVLGRYNASKFANLKSKHLSSYGENLLVSGTMQGPVDLNEFNLDVKYASNSVFLASIEPLTGNTEILKYTENTNSFSNIDIFDNNIFLAGAMEDDVDFGSGFSREHKNTGRGTNENFIWELSLDNNYYSDYSDSLWSIRNPSFSKIDTIDLGRVYINQSKDTTVLGFLINTTSEPIEISFINSNYPDFELNPTNSIKLIDSLNLDISFTPTSIGEIFTLGTINTQQGKYTFVLKGTGVEDDILVGDKVIDFGNVEINDIKRIETLAIKNNTTFKQIEISDISLEGPNKNEFSYSFTSTNQLLEPEEEMIIEYIFNPQSVGEKVAYLYISHNGNVSPQKITLLGNGRYKDSLKFTVAVDSSESDPGLINRINARIINLDVPYDINLDRIDVKISFNSTLLLPFREDNTGILLDGKRVLTLSFDSLSIFSGNDIAYNCYSTIGNSIDSEIEILEINAFQNGNIIERINPLKRNGYFKLSNVCYVNGQHRLVEQSNAIAININSISDNILDFDYELIENGYTSVSLYNTNGNFVKEIANGKHNSGIYNTNTDISDISSGVYFIQVTTPTKVFSETIQVVK